MSEETAMRATGAVFEQELIELMRSALEEAATILPQAKRTHAAKLKLASRIIAAAVKGERDPVQLRIAALLEVDDQDEGNLERSYFQLRSLREKVEQAEAAMRACPSMQDVRRTTALDINRTDMLGDQAGDLDQATNHVGRAATPRAGRGSAGLA